MVRLRDADHRQIYRRGQIFPRDMLELQSVCTVSGAGFSCQHGRIQLCSIPYQRITLLIAWVDGRMGIPPKQGLKIDFIDGDCRRHAAGIQQRPV